MSASRDYVINFGSLSPGEHEFEFEVKDSFFQRFDSSVVQRGNIDVLIVVEKKEQMLLFDFTMEGTVIVQCDRCLEDLELDIEGYNELIVKMGDENEELSENVIVISSKDYEIDVSQYIYEFITLIIPMRNVHDEEENGQACDPEILKEMEKHITNESPETPTDPRWDSLKNINLN
jgi:uncharacterized metal-binding protein YceD (DUF177 family)